MYYCLSCCLQIADSIGLPTNEGYFGFKPFSEVSALSWQQLQHALTESKMHNTCPKCNIPPSSLVHSPPQHNAYALSSPATHPRHGTGLVLVA